MTDLRLSRIKGFLLPVLCILAVIGVVLLSQAATTGSVTQNSRATVQAPSGGSAPVEQARQKPRVADTAAYLGRLNACLARNGARVERQPDGGNLVSLSRTIADDDGQTLRAITDRCQAELGVSAAPPAAPGS